MPGQNALNGPLPLPAAIVQFDSKLHDKTVKGNYRILDIVTEDQPTDQGKKDEGNQNKEEGSKKKEEEDFERSKLDKAVKSLVQLIFDLKMMNQQMKEIGYDAKKMPLGKLSKSNIEKGYKILNEIAVELKGKKNRNKIETLSSDFYSFIPHDFGFQ